MLITESYTIILGADNNVFLRTKRRHIRYRSYQQLYEQAMVKHRMIKYWYKIGITPELQAMVDEQEKDGVLQAFRDFRAWYEGRKSRALVHLRMVARLLYWHRLSVEKLWNPSDLNNKNRIMSLFTSE